MTTDVICVNCGYNLRGSVSEKCPECGVPVTRSLSVHESLKVTFSPERLSDIGAGLTYGLSALTLTIVVFIGGFMMALVGHSAMAKSAWGPSLTLGAAIGLWGTKRCTSGIPVMIGLVSALLIALRTVMTLFFDRPWATPELVMLSSLLFAGWTGSVLHRLCSVFPAGSLRTSSSRHAWKPFLAAAVVGNGAWMMEFPTTSGGQGFQFLLNAIVVVAAVVLACQVLLAARRAIPSGRSPSCAATRTPQRPGCSMRIET